jgi:hypothetical protein
MERPRAILPEVVAEPNRLQIDAVGGMVEDLGKGIEADHMGVVGWGLYFVQPTEYGPPLGQQFLGLLDELKRLHLFGRIALRAHALA